MNRPTLIIMVKVPRPGQVKTRLGRDIGMIPATWWYRHQVKRLVRRLRDPRWQIVLAVSPDVKGLSCRIWPADLPRVRQGNGDLGQRMTGVLNATTGPACLIGSDIPGVTRAHIARAFATLGPCQAVFGPSPDGGFWLFGAKASVHLPPLAGVRWSSDHALTDSLAALKNWRVALADTLSDVDTASDLAP